MQVAIALLMVIHGVIHLMGFLKAFNIAEIKDLKQPVSKKTGVFWAMAFFIFILMAILYLAAIKLWLVFGFFGIIISQALIIQAWKEAKFGTIPNIFLGILIFTSL